jgi:hypothetical protein
MASLDLTAGRPGAPPLWLLPDGTLSTTADTAPRGIAAREALLTAARWISGRRTSTFARLFPPSPFRPEVPARKERLSAAQAAALLDQLRGALAAAAVGGEEARRDATNAAQVRSAALTVLSHVVATSIKDDSFRAAGDAAVAEIFALIEREQGDPTSRPELRAHAVFLLQLRGPALSKPDRARAVALLKALVRASPPYVDLAGDWHFAMCSDAEFHEGACEILSRSYGFRAVPLPAGAPAMKGRYGPLDHAAFEAPFKTKGGGAIRILARTAHPTDENLEMAEPFFTGMLIIRHAQLGAFDLRAASVNVRQNGYKLMMNSQCAGLTTRYAISRMFPEADIYSSWDSTYFRSDRSSGSRKVIASEGVDCFVALLHGMSESESHAELEARMRGAQWEHEQAESVPSFVQFVGPAHPLVVRRHEDVNQDGRADVYDGFLDFELTAIAERMEDSMTPRSPNVPASQVGGEAASGLEWAAGSMNRVTQYSDLWAALPDRTELFYAFHAAGFYSHVEPPADLPKGKSDVDPGLLPAVCRYTRGALSSGLEGEVMFHAYLCHAGKELKRLLVAADALWRAADLGHFDGRRELETGFGRRGMLLLTLAGLLEFPADQNYVDGLWSMALKALRLPPLSRSLVRAATTDADHAANNYYGSKRGLTHLRELLQESEPLAYQKLARGGVEVGRAAELDVK